MLKKHAQFFESLFFISDLIIISIAWVLSYYLRFYLDPIQDPAFGIPSILSYLGFLFPLWLAWGLGSKWIHLYHPRRIEHLLKELFDLVKVLTVTFLILITLIYFLKGDFSRLTFISFWVIAISGLILMRVGLRKTFKTLRKRGFNQRFAFIAGTGDLGRKVLEKVEGYPELGIHVIGFLTHDRREVGKNIKGFPILGVYEDVEKIVPERRPDIFFIALSIHEHGHLAILLEKLQGHLMDIKVVPGAYEFLSLRGGMDELDGLPILSLQSSPLYGWNSVFKRIFDLLLGILLLLLAFPFIVVISILIMSTSKGPIFYRQERVEMDGYPFEMLKFRTMRWDAEKETGPVWAQEDDPRRTKVGVFLRSLSLDELPQLFNVIKGEMSLVGPRPERPNFIEEFRNKIPLYMLRHKIKAGMTGWAQVNGWRGNTSLEKRLEHDLYYIQHWSIGFDLRILLMTLWKGFFNKSAY